jgi:hypothetical protein
MELRAHEKIEQLNIDEALKLYNKEEELDFKIERRRKRRFLRQSSNKNLPTNFFQNIVELENIMLMGPTKDNIFELVTLYKVFIINY